MCTLRHTLFLALVLLLTSGCYRGYKSVDELEDDDRGPKACETSCRDLKMQMTAFVLVEHGTSGCVCSPVTATPPPGPVAAAAASHVVIEEQRQQAAAQQAAAQQATATQGLK
jgi:hypothetical protein